nr:immunoglobulin kappa light chain [Acipenser ruthenus]
MISLSVLVCLLIVWTKDSRGDITVDQSPPAISVVPGQTVTIKCKASQVIDSDMELYQLKPGHAPKMLIYNGNTLVTGTPSRFSGTWSGADHTFTISNVQSEDDAEYHCGQSDAFPYTFGQGTRLIVKSRALASPVVSLLPPSAEELSKNWATLVCLVDKFYPDIVEVVWEIDDKSQTDGILNSKSLKASDNTYSMSSILTLTRAKWESSEKYSCIIKHENSAAPIVSTINRSQCTTA